VWNPVVVGADRTDKEGGRPFARRQIGPRTAQHAEIAIGASILGRLHRVADINDLAFHGVVGGGLEIGKGWKHDDIPLKPRLGGGTAAAQRRDGQPLGIRRREFSRLDPAYPGLHRKGLDRDILESKRLELLHAPIARSRFGFGSGEALSDFGGQSFDQRPGDGVVRRCRSGSGGKDEERRKRQAQFFHARWLTRLHGFANGMAFR